MISPPPKVSVIIATYNKASALRYAIDSVLWQTFSDYELWVIGDACTDESEQLVTSYGDPRVFWHNLPQNSGYQSAPNNEGLRRARGEYVAYLNHDDLWLPNHLQVLLDRIEESGADFAYSILEMIYLHRGAAIKKPANDGEAACKKLHDDTSRALYDVLYRGFFEHRLSSADIDILRRCVMIDDMHLPRQIGVEGFESRRYRK